MFKRFLTRCIINDRHVNGISISLLIGFNFFLFFFSFFFISFFFFSLFFFSFFLSFFFSLFLCRFLSLSFSFIFIRFRITFSNNFTISISGKFIVTNTFFTITYQKTIVVKNITRTILVRLHTSYRVCFNDTTQPIQTFIIKQCSVR